MRLSIYTSSFSIPLPPRRLRVVCLTSSKIQIRLLADVTGARRLALVDAGARLVLCGGGVSLFEGGGSAFRLMCGIRPALDGLGFVLEGRAGLVVHRVGGGFRGCDGREDGEEEKAGLHFFLLGFLG